MENQELPAPTPSVPNFNSFWKWNAIYERPTALEPTWQRWLATSQLEEQMADLRYWANRTAPS